VLADFALHLRKGHKKHGLVGGTCFALGGMTLITEIMDTVVGFHRRFSRAVGWSELLSRWIVYEYEYIIIDLAHTYRRRRRRNNT